MIIGPVLALDLDLSVAPELDKKFIARHEFEYKWWEDKCPQPVSAKDHCEDEEALFRMLLDTVERELRKSQGQEESFRKTMGPRLD